MKKFFLLLGLIASILITACEPAITGITISKSSLELEVGEKATLSASVQPAGVKDVAIQWSSSNSACVTVVNGALEAKSTGTVTITASAGEVSATCQVTVKPKSVKGITLDKTAETLEIGASFTLTATITPPDAEGGKVEWSSSSACVTVKDGVVTAVEKGEATVTASVGAFSATCKVTVIGKTVKSITLDKTELTIKKGQQVQITATILPEDADYEKIVWKSSDINCVSVEDGVVKGIDDGIASITATAGNKSASCQVTVLSFDAEAERAALVALYKATDGDNWTVNSNWCSARPVKDWYGVETDSHGSVINLLLGKNNLSGLIPPEIGNLYNLKRLDLLNNNISGLPEEIGNLSNLSILDLCFAGSLGELPSGLGSLNNLDYLRMYESGITGKIPSSILNNPNIWDRFWNTILQNNKVETDGLPLPVNTPYDDYIFEKMEGDGSIRLFDEYASNKYTVMYSWAKWCPYSTAFTPELISIYNRYHSKGLQVIGYCCPQGVEDPGKKTENQIREELSEYAKSVGMPWNNYFIDYEKGSPAYRTEQSKLWPAVVPAVMVVDPTGNAIFADAYGVGDRENFESFIKGLLGDGEPIYESTDYSADGKVKTIQKHSAGNGIKLVFTGDAFTDKDIADGKFDARVTQAVEAFFKEEPYKSLRDRFDVYSVTAVSKNGEVSVSTETAFSTVFGSGSEIDGNRQKVFEYASKVPGIDISKATINVIVNSSHYGGTCYMYSDNSNISFTPIISFDDELFAQCVSHETAGHGFAKLKDEYDYGKAITEEAKADFLREKEWGWGANVDIVGTPSQIQWSFMLNDSRYNDFVGIFEGALTFGSGAWRPTLNSIMRFNTGGFNAPSRFAIYKRIIELSEGRTATFEEFASFDAKNLKASAKMMSAPKKTNDKFVPFAPPVVIKGGWRD